MDLDARIRNRTTLSARAFPMEDRRGCEILVVILKSAHALSADGRARPLLGAPIRLSDERVSGSPRSSVRYPSDLVDEKAGADVILVGTAHPPPDRDVTDMMVSLRVETGLVTLYKAVRVFGPRVYYQGARGVVPGPPARLGTTPLRYESAYGGVDDTDPRHPMIERRNPAGSGFAVDRARLLGSPAPAIEDPDHPLSSPSPAPAGFGPIAPDWSPRVERAGTYDDTWRRERAPLLPLDFDLRHHSCAEPALHSEEPLSGRESVEILGAVPEGAWRFRVPRRAPVVTALVHGSRVEIRPRIDTLLVDADERRVELTFRARLPRPRKMNDLAEIRIDDIEPPSQST